MARANPVSRLLAHVYGPYPDHIILKDDFPRPGVKLAMTALQLNFSGNRQIIGFDETEYITNPPEGSRLAQNPEVVFFGIIEIEDLEWLSEQGLAYLERDFRDYDQKIHLAHCQTALTIKSYFRNRKSNGPRLKVQLCCRKTLLAHFLTSKNDPEKLLIYSQFEQMKRTYWVKSLHVAAYAASRNFFDRYRLRALVVELMETDPDKTPLEGRNIDWVLRRYFDTIRPRDRENRIIADETLELDVAAEPRHLRHIPSAEIRGYFAAHSEWLLAHLIARQQGSANLLNVRQWLAFCREARQDANAAQQHHVRWGVPHGQQLNLNGSHSLARRLAQFGETEHFWANRLKSLQQKKTHKKRQQMSPEIELPHNTVPEVIRFQYDSDFSEPSTPEASDSESEVRTDYKIPGFCMEAPRIPSGRFAWNCPGCPYQIDLLNLLPENLDSLPDDTIRVLNGKSWKVNDKPVQRALFRLVSHHYEVHHLARSGINVIQSEAGRWLVQNQQSSLRQGRQKDTGIKTEDGESQMLENLTVRSGRRT
ncbi:hypothetical protein GALMADRAFT_236453 [Galerina marginata CBS 339.88]|uniref:Uncharacterized protein n=1 Tax=Galerina marginata (strain CBS 339.88) TaxID=685588 RepID=A0A067TL86_GALM3|nr:hypothetical protein GALMADRAFT_236453 [Galerina marginata CBS 339.88]